MNILVRELSRLEHPSLEPHFLALDAEDRRLRFGVSLNDDAVRAYVARIDFERDAALGVYDDALRLIGAAHVAKAKPDGYTVLLWHIGMSTAPALYRKLSFNPLTDFEYIGQVADVPMALIAAKKVPANDFKEFLTYLKANKNKMTYGNAGLGAASHLCGLLFMSAIQTDVQTVSYKGTAPAMTDLMGGQIDFMCDQTTNTTGQIKAGQVKAYGVFTDARLKALPDLPTIKEGGLEGLSFGIWHGLYAPAGTPDATVSKLSEALKTALADPNVIERFAELGTEPVPADQATPAALQAKVTSEIDRWKPVIDKAGIYAD